MPIDGRLGKTRPYRSSSEMKNTRPTKRSSDVYASITLTDDDIAQEVYKQHLGGGAANWAMRGTFQFELLRHMGLAPEQTLLDVGCGPLRGGEHLIRFLDRDSYCGIDHNRDFIRAAMCIVQNDWRLYEKNPNLRTIENFDFAAVYKEFDFILAFSVLNHCNHRLRRRFFRNAAGASKRGTRIIVTHGQWYTPLSTFMSGLQLKVRIDNARNLPKALNPNEWGWSGSESIFPILEFAIANHVRPPVRHKPR